MRTFSSSSSSWFRSGAVAELRVARVVLEPQEITGLLSTSGEYRKHAFSTPQTLTAHSGYSLLICRLSYTDGKE